MMMFRQRISLWILTVACSATAASAGVPSTETLTAGEPTTYCATQILVSYWGALGASVVRSSETSLAIAEKALARVREPGADFGAIGQALEESERDVFYGRTGPVGRDDVPGPLFDALGSLRPGQIADRIIQTQYGYHVVRREPTVRCRHILVAYQGASRAIVDRTKEEARQRADKILAETRKPGADFAALARRDSDAPDARRGGDVGVFDRGMMVKSFENAAFALEVGEVSPIVETRFGYHIIQRIE
jgi:parvulin-like peptidyl-prolyl isomerase